MAGRFAIGSSRRSKAGVSFLTGLSGIGLPFWCQHEIDRVAPPYDGYSCSDETSASLSIESCSLRTRIGVTTCRYSYSCTPAEIERFLRDASAERYDGELLVEMDAEEFFDPESVRWYRRVFDETQPRQTSGTVRRRIPERMGICRRTRRPLGAHASGGARVRSRASRAPDTPATGRRLAVHRRSLPLLVSRPPLERPYRRRGESRPGVVDAVRALYEACRAPVRRQCGDAPEG